MAKVYMNEHKFRVIYKDYTESGLSITKYCEENDLLSTSFYRWIKTYIRNNSSNKETSKISPITILEDSNNIIPKNDFASNTAALASTQSNNNSIIIEHPNGVKIRFEGSIDQTLLLTILSQL